MEIEIDQTLSEIIEYFQNWRSNRERLEGNTSLHYNSRNKVKSENGILCLYEKIIILKKVRPSDFKITA